MKKAFLALLILVFLVSFSSNLYASSTSTSDASAAAGAASAATQDQAQQNSMSVQDVGNIKDSFNSQGMRGFAIPGDVSHGPLINYYGKPEPSSAFQDIRMLIMYGGCFSEGALESLLSKVESADAEFKVVNKGIGATHEEGITRWIKIVVTAEKLPDVNFVGYVTGRSNDEDTTMVEVMAKAALEALKNGCNVIQFTGQGAVRDAFAKGWGIGFNHTTAYIADQQDRSNVSTGGFGYSSAKAGVRDKPWLQGFGLFDPKLTFPSDRETAK